MKYLTIENYTDQFTAINDCLHTTLEIHRSFKPEVNLESKDKRCAIFLLLGSAIDASFLGLEFYRGCQFASLLHINRYVVELSALIEYFIVDDSEIESWFNDSFVSARPTPRTKKKLRPIIPKKAATPSIRTTTSCDFYPKTSHNTKNRGFTKCLKSKPDEFLRRTTDSGDSHHESKHIRGFNRPHATDFSVSRSTS